MDREIVEIQATAFILPLSSKFASWRIANRAASSATAGYVLVRVRTKGGATGYGEAGRFCDGETPKGIALSITEVLAPAIQGADVLDVECLRTRMDRVIVRNEHAKSAVEMALLDASGKLLDLPVHMLLGGRFRDEVPVCARLSVADAPEKAAESAAEAVAEGYGCVKVKVGEDPVRDLETIERIRSAIGEGVAIRIDANEGYRRSDLPTLLKMEELGLLVVEQPLRAADTQGLAAFSARLSAPVMLDESVNNASSVYRAGWLNSADAIQVKIGKASGILGARRMLDAARAAGLDAGIGSMMESGLGASAVLQLAASTPELSFPLETSGARTFADGDVLSHWLAPDEGMLRVPDGPGLGVEVDEAAVAYYRI